MLEEIQRFDHPMGIYNLEYPAEWIVVIEGGGVNCAFGWEDSDDVGVWISVLPYGIDPEAMEEELRESFEQAAGDRYRAIREDENLRHFGFRADSNLSGDGGSAWMLTTGEVVLFVSTSVPLEEKSDFDPTFERLLQSLEIAFEEEQAELEEDWDAGEEIDEVEENPDAEPSQIEEWGEVRDRIFPILKSRSYFSEEAGMEHLHWREWQGDVVVGYAIKKGETQVFLRKWDLEQWQLDQAAIHEQAMSNLSGTNWPAVLKKKRFKPRRVGRLILINGSRDGVGASKLLDSRLHHLFAPHLGPAFCAAIPHRDLVLLFQEDDLEEAKETVARHHREGEFPISPEILFVTADNVRSAENKP